MWYPLFFYPLSYNFSLSPVKICFLIAICWHFSILCVSLLPLSPYSVAFHYLLSLYVFLSPYPVESFLVSECMLSGGSKPSPNAFLPYGLAFFLKFPKPAYFILKILSLLYKRASFLPVSLPSPTLVLTAYKSVGGHPGAR